MQNMLIDLQHFDLAGPVIPRLDRFLPLVDPMVLLWDNHDLREIRTHGLVFQMGVGKGQLLVSALKHTGETNSAGNWLFYQLALNLYGKIHVDDATRQEALSILSSELNHRTLELHDRPWKFKPRSGE